MAVLMAGQVGEQNLGGSAVGANIRQDPLAALVVSELAGRFYELVRTNRLYSGGITALTTIAAATFTTATLGATCTPIIGLWNPLGSNINAMILQAQLVQIMTALAATGGGPMVWCTATAQSAISTGNNPLNRKTLLKSGSVCKDMSGVALTGLVGSLVVGFGSAMGGGSAENASFTATAAGMQTQVQPGVENFDGSIIIPPGGVLALLTTTTPVAHSVTSGLLWGEMPAV